MRAPTSRATSRPAWSRRSRAPTTRSALPASSRWQCCSPTSSASRACVHPSRQARSSRCCAGSMAGWRKRCSRPRGPWTSSSVTVSWRPSERRRAALPMPPMPCAALAPWSRRRVTSTPNEDAWARRRSALPSGSITDPRCWATSAMSGASSLPRSATPSIWRAGWRILPVTSMPASWSAIRWSPPSGRRIPTPSAKLPTYTCTRRKWFVALTKQCRFGPWRRVRWLACPPQPIPSMRRLAARSGPPAAKSSKLFSVTRMMCWAMNSAPSRAPSSGFLRQHSHSSTAQLA
jgi:hypothetical protein